MFLVGRLYVFRRTDTMDEQAREGPLEIALVGDLTESEAELTDKLLAVEPGGECTLYIDSPGGSPYCAMSLTAADYAARPASHRHCHRRMFVRGPVAVRRLPPPHGHALQHSAVSSDEMAKRRARRPARSTEWARHFDQLETDMDRFLGDLFGAARRRYSAMDHVASLRFRSGIGRSRFGRADRFQNARHLPRRQ